MLSLILNVLYVLVALAMIVLIMLQQGKGAQAGSGFGSGASGTVFGSRGAASFLSKTTRWLAIAFFSITMLMAWMFVHGGQKQVAAAGSSIMTAQPAAPATKTAPPAAAPQQGIPQAPATTVPQAPAQNAAQAPANAQGGAPAGSQTR